MESTTIIKLRSLEPYRHLFPRALAIDTTIKKGAGVSDTVAFIPMIVQKTRWQAREFVNQELRGLSLYNACEKLWYFVKYHIRYEKDERGLEQVRSVRRLIHDGVGDCDCFTTFIDTCLTELGVKGIINRITKYKENFFQHIYPIVPIGNGRYITMDCVVDKFNYEEPYTEKKDYNMDLQYLDGIDEQKLNGNVDAQDLFGWDNETGDLGKLFKRSQSTSAMPAGNQGGQGKKKGFQKVKNFAKRALNVTNKANPATALLRAGILASMKLNVLKVPQKLKWAYLSEAEAKQKGADMAKFDHLKKVLYKMEQVFFTAGGSPENLRKAILTGRGNRNKEVNGLGLVDGYNMNMSGVNEYTDLPTLLGTSVYHDEFVNGLEGTEGLGSAVAAGAAVASASTIMATIAALLKSVGNIFPNKKVGNDFNDDGTSTSEGNANENNSSTSESSNSENSSGDNLTNEDKTSNSNASTNNTSSESNSNPKGGESSVSTANTSNEVSTTGKENAAARTGDANAKGESISDTTSDEPKKGLKEFWDKNKKWIKPVGIGITAVSVAYLGFKAWKKKQDEKKGGSKKSQPALNGVDKKKKTKKEKAKQGGKKEIKALM